MSASWKLRDIARSISDRKATATEQILTRGSKRCAAKTSASGSESATTSLNPTTARPKVAATGTKSKKPKSTTRSTTSLDTITSAPMFPNLKRHHAEDPDASASPAVVGGKKQKQTKDEKATSKNEPTRKKPAATAKKMPTKVADRTKAKKAPATKAEPQKAEVKKVTAKGAVTKKPRDEVLGAIRLPPRTTQAKKVASPAPAKAKKESTPASKKSTSSRETTPAKRKAEDTNDAEPVKKARTTAAKKPGRKTKAAAAAINEAPATRLKVFVFGENGNGELGLGHENLPDKKITNVTRPRLNPHLDPEAVGVTQLAAGGMHVVALTHDNLILTWGVNDQGALGRETKQAEQLRDAEDEDDEDEEYVEDANGNKKWPVNTGLNMLEATPGMASMEKIPEGTIWTQVAAGDSMTFAVTSTGLVYGCGTFRSNDGILGFSPQVRVQAALTQVAGLKDIVSVACGDNHVIALDAKGNVCTFGSGQQNQLGRRVVERNRLNGLVPREVALPKGKTAQVVAGAYHSFALDTAGNVWAWGLNSFGETGVPAGAGDDGALVLHPEKVTSLKGAGVVGLAGGAHHSLAVTDQGHVLAWGRCDGGQSGIDPGGIPADNFFVDAAGNANDRLLATPTRVAGVDGRAVQVAAGTDSCFAVTAAGKAFSWGFSENFQTGQGTGEDVEEALLVDNSAVRGEHLVWAGAGGQYGVLASAAE